MSNYINTIAFLVTKQCNADCDICCFSCSPSNKETIDFDLVNRIIKEAKEISSIKTIGFSGGEPFILYEDIIKASALASKNNFRVTCTTNGFWAINKVVTKEKLERFKKNGLTKLGVSVDEFHNEYVNIENIKYILECCKLLNIEVELGSVITRKRKNIYKLFEYLDDSMIGINHQIAPCLPVGNASLRINKEDFYYDSKVINNKSICTGLTFLAVMPNGNVYPCCSQAGATDPLLVGNIKELSLKNILKNFNSNMTIRVLKKKGLKWYLDIAQEYNYDKFITKEYVNTCDLCRTILSDREFINSTSPYIEKYKIEIYKRYKEMILNGNKK